MVRTGVAARTAWGCIAAVVAMGLVAGGCTSRSDDGFDDCAEDRDGPGALVGVDAASGELRWSRTVGDAPVEAADGTMVRVSDGEVDTFDVTTGAARSCQPSVPSTEESPAATVTTSSTFATGQPLDPPTDVTGVPTDDEVIAARMAEASGGLVMVSRQAAGDRQQEILVSDHATGELRWTRTLPGVVAYLDRDLVLVVDQPLGAAKPAPGATTFVALRAADGSELWRTT
ncbi:MAG TPA: PQQ-binding-like beta-propeller repeat protein, partial [Acidimicrobiales bacterium]